jgi:transcription elongation GreA/GreB family factor
MSRLNLSTPASSGPVRGVVTESCHLTPGGFLRLVSKIERARAAYFAVCATNEEAAGAGDNSVWHDNFAYEENQRQMHQLARRVRDLEAIKAGGVVSPLPTGVPTVVRMGVVVGLLLEDGSQVERMVAGFEDGEPEAGRLAYNSQLGRTLLGREVGDIVTVGTSAGSRRAEIVGMRIATQSEDERSDR